MRVKFNYATKTGQSYKKVAAGLNTPTSTIMREEGKALIRKKQKQ